jgi:hypothetical protein
VAYNRLERKRVERQNPCANWKKIKYHLNPIDEYNIYRILKHILGEWQVVKSGGYFPKMTLSVIYSADRCHLSAPFWIDEMPDNLIRQIMYAGRPFKDIFVDVPIPQENDDGWKILIIDGIPVYIFLDKSHEQFYQSLRAYYDKSDTLQRVIKRPLHNFQNDSNRGRIYLLSAKSRVYIKNLKTLEDTVLPVQKGTNNYYYSDF